MRKDVALGLVVLAFAGGVAVGRYARSDAGKATAEAGVGKNVATAALEVEPESFPSPSEGPENAKVTIVEVSDFQCPFCAKARDTVHQVLQAYPGDVRLIFKHNPLPMHKDAMAAAIASMAAHRQGKFWEMHDKLFANPKALQPSDIEGYARQVGLDLERFKKDLADPEIRKKIDRDQRAAEALGARGTPAFFINGQYQKGAIDLAKFKELIDAELKRADRLLAKGVPAESLHYRLAQETPGTRAYVNLWIRNVEPPRRSEKAAAQGAQEDTKTVWRVTLTGQEAVKGPADAAVTIVEVSDFECPFCAKVLPTLHEIEKAYGNQVRFVFKHSPLDFHKRARLAAEASLAARAQGKFWEMHDKLFENQKALERPDLERYAQELGLDLVAFKRDLDEGTHRAEIDADLRLAGKINARGTPNLYINGRQLTGAKSFDEIKPIIDEELQKVAKLKQEGVPAGEVYARIVGAGKVFDPLDARVYDIPVANSPIHGAAEAPVTVTVFTDFQCPYCSRAAGPLKAVADHFAGKVRLMVKMMPLVSIHKDAMLAAEAALAAHAQGRFFAMHDILFQNQKKLSRADIDGYAAQIGLDLARFKADLDGHVYRAAVQRDMDAASAAGVKGTPTVFINGRLFKPAGGYDLNSFRPVLEENFLK